MKAPAAASSRRPAGSSCRRAVRPRAASSSDQSIVVTAYISPAGLASLNRRCVLLRGGDDQNLPVRAYDHLLQPERFGPGELDRVGWYQSSAYQRLQVRAMRTAGLRVAARLLGGGHFGRWPAVVADLGQQPGIDQDTA